ncbi:MAG: endonuclease/exonuclease/phosphatase family protein [Gammaproteobacteria bacterium]
MCALAGCAAAPIPAIQGASHHSPYAGRSVSVRGVVTAVEGRGFYLQDETGDDDPATSDGIFVYTKKRPSVGVGDRLKITAEVQEFVPGGARTGNLSVTELAGPVMERLGHVERLPAPIVIGTNGRQLPASRIDDDELKRFEPADDAIDFFETLEGMRVRVSQPVAVSALNEYGEIFVLHDRGRFATGRNARGGITLTAGDRNPERLQIQLDRQSIRRLQPGPDTGAFLDEVVGVVGYAFGNYEIRVTEPFDIQPSRIDREITALRASPAHLTLAGFNLHALAASRGGRGRFAVLARRIVTHLGSPDIIAAQEIGDDDGAVDSGEVDARHTAALLIAAIEAAGGPRYRYVDLPPEDGADGGPPGGNIRVGFFYEPTRVTLVADSLKRLEDTNAADGDSFSASRKPLVAEFMFNDARLVVVNVHLSSKRGGTPLFGRVRPPVDGNAGRRAAQAALIAERVDEIARDHAGANIVVAGDFNDFDFAIPLEILGRSGGGLVNLMRTLPERERYTYVFDGNAQALDHVLVSPALAAEAELDIVHVNAEFAEQASDHDPVVVRLFMPAADNRTVAR